MHLALRGYRNLQPLDWQPGARFNVFFGDNGAGKSNLLEAIFYLSSLRSFRGARGEELIAHRSEAAQLSASIEAPGFPQKRSLQLFRARPRRLLIDDKRPRSLALWSRDLPQVIFHPGHLALISGPPELRREFIDAMLVAFDPTYGAALAAYQRALRSRNRLIRLKQLQPASLRAFDEIMATSGVVLIAARASLVSELAPRAAEAFEEVIGEDFPLELHYKPRVEGEIEQIRRSLAQSLEKDLALGFTAEGPHMDELLILTKRTQAKHFASQGQQRAAVLALKMAELDLLSRHLGRVPTLLLDDVSSELDRQRNRRFFGRLGRMGGQVFLTTTRPELIELDHPRSDLHLEAGEAKAPKA